MTETLRPEVTKNEVFASDDYCGIDKYFLDCFPDMPDPYQGATLEGAINYNIMALMTDLGFLYYLPLFTQFVAQNPRLPLNLEFMLCRIEKLSLSLQKEFAPLIDAYWVAADEYDRQMELYGPLNKHEFRPE